VSRESFAREQDHLLLIIDEDGHRWASFSKDLESLACCCRTVQCSRVCGARLHLRLTGPVIVPFKRVYGSGWPLLSCSNKTSSRLERESLESLHETWCDCRLTQCGHAEDEEEDLEWRN